MNFDEVTRAGNLENLACVSRDARHISVQGDLGHRELVGRLSARHRLRPVINFAVKNHVDRSIHGSEDRIFGTLGLLEAVRVHWSALPETERMAFGCLDVSTDEVHCCLSNVDPPLPRPTASNQ